LESHVVRRGVVYTTGHFLLPVCRHELLKYFLKANVIHRKNFLNVLLPKQILTLLLPVWQLIVQWLVVSYKEVSQSLRRSLVRILLTYCYVHQEFYELESSDSSIFTVTSDQAIELLPRYRIPVFLELE